MQFKLTRPALIGPAPGVPFQYIEASFSAPVRLELPDDVSLDHVSRTWEPMDAAAQAALRKLGVEKPLVVDEISAPWPPEAAAASADAAPASPGDTPDETRRV